MKHYLLFAAVDFTSTALQDSTWLSILHSMVTQPQCLAQHQTWSKGQICYKYVTAVYVRIMMEPSLLRS